MLSRRSAGFKPSAIRDLLKSTEQPDMISLAGGLPAPHGFPISALANAAARILAQDGMAALQYAGSEGYGPLRSAIAEHLPWKVDPAQVLITTGSQQALDLLGKVLIDSGSRILLETPTYPGAVQAFSPMEPTWVSTPSDEQGVLPDALAALRGSGIDKPRLLYVQPNFQNPTGRTMSASRRQALLAQATALHIPIVEDDPYGALWFDQPPPLPLAASNPEGCVYVGSFSKVLAPGLRVGFLVAPKPVYARLLLAKQASDLHSTGLCQRLVYALLENGTLAQHMVAMRELYRHQRDAMLTALQQHMAPLGARWNIPEGGMFVWLQLPAGIPAARLLPLALARNVAFIPGAAFDDSGAYACHIRLSYATCTPQQASAGIAALADSIVTWQQKRRRA